MYNIHMQASPTLISYIEKGGEQAVVTTEVSKMSMEQIAAERSVFLSNFGKLFALPLTSDQEIRRKNVVGFLQGKIDGVMTDLAA